VRQNEAQWLKFGKGKWSKIGDDKSREGSRKDIRRATHCRAGVYSSGLAWHGDISSVKEMKA